MAVPVALSGATLFGRRPNGYAYSDHKGYFASAADAFSACSLFGVCRPRHSGIRRRGGDRAERLCPGLFARRLYRGGLHPVQRARRSRQTRPGDGLSQQRVPSGGAARGERRLPARRLGERALRRRNRRGLSVLCLPAHFPGAFRFGPGRAQRLHRHPLPPRGGAAAF